MMQYRAELMARDGEGNRGRVYARFSVPSSFPAARDTTALPFVAAVSGISDARIIQYRCIWTDRISTGGLPAEGTNLQDAVLFLFRTSDDEYLGFTVPAPKASIFEQTGDYAGILVRAEVCSFVLDLLEQFPPGDPLAPGIAANLVECIGVRVV